MFLKNFDFIAKSLQQYKVVNDLSTRQMLHVVLRKVELVDQGFRFHGKTPNRVIGEKKEFILLGDLNCDLLPETMSKSMHLVHIYNTYGLTQVIKEATRTTAETNTLTYYIATNKKDNVADSGIIPCGIGDHDLVYVIRHARLPKMKKD